MWVVPWSAQKNRLNQTKRGANVCFAFWLERGRSRKIKCIKMRRMRREVSRRMRRRRRRWEKDHGIKAWELL